jgi:zinc transport system ATP-binding protein
VKAPPAIEFCNVSFSYDGHPALRGIELTIAERDFATVVGPNGGGKTTLLRLTLGLLRPATGTIRVFGLRPEEVRSRVGYVPQRSVSEQDFPARVIDVVLMGRLDGKRMLGPYSARDREAALAALGEVELLDHAARAFSDLSGGERQRTLIARALASEPDMLLLDEPTANLDVAMEEDLYRLLQRLHGRLTIVLVTHDLGFVSDFAETVICVKQTLACHETGALTGDMIREMYGRDVRVVLHDHGDHYDGGRR